jgi:tetratricopeptide (TPR) repeat protein
LTAKIFNLLLLRFIVMNCSVQSKVLISLLLLIIVVLGSCSSERNTWTSKAYHNTTAHFNGYYYAREELKKIETDHWAGMQDDYNRILRLYPLLDSSVVKAHDKEIQEAIKMASIAIQRHPNSKWVDDCYLLVGQARLYSLDWGNAIQTYKFVNTKSKDPDARHKAIIGLVRTFTEHKEFNNAQAAIDYLQKEELNKANKKAFGLEKAYFYQMQGNLDYMVRSLAPVQDDLKRKDRAGRVYFILGQVYQKLGFESEAYQFYKKCLSTNPEYEIDFYARLYMAQVTEISRNRNVAAARKSFRKLLKDGKNKDFQDKIYYEMGMFELKQKNIPEAIAEFNKTIRLGKNKQIDGEAFLRLGEIYYDTLKKYELSQAYYDSAISSLSPDYEGYEQIKARSEILDEFVKALNTIKLQDSLLRLASLDSVTLFQKVDSTYQSKKRAEEELARKRKKSNRVQIVANTNNDLFGSSEDEDGQMASNDEGSEWYFANPTAMTIGQNEFKRIWGDVTLEDNWRRSQRSMAGTANRRGAATTPTPANTDADEKPTETADPVVAEFKKINLLIPRTDAQRKEALIKIENAYFSLGDIYYFKLLEKENAALAYKTLLARFPESEFEPEVLYRLYLIYKDSDEGVAEQYATQLKKDHPGSTFAKILVNPNYLAESSLALKKQQGLYKVAYEHFEHGEFSASLKVIDEAAQLGETSFSPQLDLLKILIAGRTEEVGVYQSQLEEFSKKHANSPSGDYAKKLLETSKQFVSRQEKNNGIQYLRSLEEPHYFVIVHKKSENLGNKPSSVLEKFNEKYFKEYKLRTSNLVLNDDYIITLVADLPRVSAAIEYVRTFNEKLTGMPELRNHKFNNFVITKDNFDIFYRTKGLDEYIYFFEKNYPADNQ